MDANKKCFFGEAAMLIGLLINSFGVTLMVASNFGVSTISSLPYVVSKAFPLFTFGTWNYIFQTSLLVSLVLLTRRFSIGYVLSFAVGVAFGLLVDVFTPLMALLPVSLPARLLYFVSSFLILAFGISLLINCGLPVIPTDVFPRDLSAYFRCTYKKVKTIFDIACLTVTLLISFLILRYLEGIGVGTVICAFITGKAVSMFSDILNRRFYFRPRFAFLDKLN